MMRIQRFGTLAKLNRYAGVWNELSRGVPFRSWEWLSTWWRHYGLCAADGQVRELFVLGVLDDDDRLVGIAPWYVDASRTAGRVVRFLGTGEVYSDYLSLLCRRGSEEAIAAAVATWLLGDEATAWDAIELTGIDREDRAVGALLDRVRPRTTVRCRDGLNCWRIAMPDRWDDYLTRLSKSQRKTLRRADRRYFDTGRAVLHTVERGGDVQPAMDLLIKLHQQRWTSRGRAGCFASERFAAFHRDVAEQLFRAGQLELNWLELDGRPAAAEYNLASRDVIYSYQAGVDPAVLADEPGRLIMVAILKRAIAGRHVVYDLLRGDEPYKQHWNAEPRATLDVRIAAPHAAAKIRHAAWLAGSTARQAAKRSVRTARQSLATARSLL